MSSEINVKVDFPVQETVVNESTAVPLKPLDTLLKGERSKLETNVAKQVNSNSAYDDILIKDIMELCHNANPAPKINSDTVTSLPLLSAENNVNPNRLPDSVEKIPSFKFVSSDFRISILKTRMKCKTAVQTKEGENNLNDSLLDYALAELDSSAAHDQGNCAEKTDITEVKKRSTTNESLIRCTATSRGTSTTDNDASSSKRQEHSPELHQMKESILTELNTYSDNEADITCLKEVRTKEAMGNTFVSEVVQAASNNWSAMPIDINKPVPLLTSHAKLTSATSAACAQQSLAPTHVAATSGFTNPQTVSSAAVEQWSEQPLNIPVSVHASTELGSSINKNFGHESEAADSNMVTRASSVIVSGSDKVTFMPKCCLALRQQCETIRTNCDSTTSHEPIDIKSMSDGSAELGHQCETIATSSGSVRDPELSGTNLTSSTSAKQSSGRHSFVHHLSDDLNEKKSATWDKGVAECNGSQHEAMRNNVSLSTPACLVSSTPLATSKKLVDYSNWSEDDDDTIFYNTRTKLEDIFSEDGDDSTLNGDDYNSTTLKVNGEDKTVVASVLYDPSPGRFKGVCYVPEMKLQDAEDSNPLTLGDVSTLDKYPIKTVPSWATAKSKDLNINKDITGTVISNAINPSKCSSVLGDSGSVFARTDDEESICSLISHPNMDEMITIDEYFSGQESTVENKMELEIANTSATICKGGSVKGSLVKPVDDDSDDLSDYDELIRDSMPSKSDSILDIRTVDMKSADSDCEILETRSESSCTDVRKWGNTVLYDSDDSDIVVLDSISPGGTVTERRSYEAKVDDNIIVISSDSDHDILSLHPDPDDSLCKETCEQKTSGNTKINKKVGPIKLKRNGTIAGIDSVLKSQRTKSADQQKISDSGSKRVESPGKIIPTVRRVAVLLNEAKASLVRKKWMSNGIPSPETNLTCATFLRTRSARKGQLEAGILEGNNCDFKGKENSKTTVSGKRKREDDFEETQHKDKKPKLVDSDPVAAGIKSTIDDDTKVELQNMGIEATRKIEDLNYIDRSVRRTMEDSHQIKKRVLNVNHFHDLQVFHRLPFSLGIQSRYHATLRDHYEEKQLLFSQQSAEITDHDRKYAALIQKEKDAFEEKKRKIIEEARIKMSASDLFLADAKYIKLDVSGHRDSRCRSEVTYLPQDIADEILSEEKLYDSYYTDNSAT